MPKKSGSNKDAKVVDEDSTTQLIKGIKALEKQVKSDAASVGLVVDIRDRLYDESLEIKVRLAAFHALRRIFCSFLEIGLLTKAKLDNGGKIKSKRRKAEENDGDYDDSMIQQQQEEQEDKSSRWLKDRLIEYQEYLCQLIKTNSEEFMAPAIRTMGELTRREWLMGPNMIMNKDGTPKEKRSCVFGLHAYTSLIHSFVFSTTEIDADVLLLLRAELFDKKDCKFYTWLIIKSTLQTIKDEVAQSTEATAASIALSNKNKNSKRDKSKNKFQESVNGKQDERVTNCVRNCIDLLRVLSIEDQETLDEMELLVNSEDFDIPSIPDNGNDSGGNDGNIGDSSDEDDEEVDEAYGDDHYYTEESDPYDNKEKQKKKKGENEEEAGDVEVRRKPSANTLWVSNEAVLAERKRKRKEKNAKPSGDAVDPTLAHIQQFFANKKAGNKAKTGKGTKKKHFDKMSRMEQMKTASAHVKVFSKAWLTLLSMPMNSDQHLLVLEHLPQHVTTNLDNPLLLADYLTRSYNHGGAVSIIALESLFHLIVNHNLDYPDFFPSLYRLCKIELFYLPTGEKLMRLLNMCLKSSNLQAYVVAAFIKRLMMIAVNALPHVGLYCVAQSIWLLRNHPQTQVLIHRETAGNPGIDLSKRAGEEDDVYGMIDPFDPSEEHDLEKTRALDSSLWEVLDVQEHYYPPLAEMAKSLESELSTKNTVDAPYLNVEDFIGFQIQDLISNEFDRVEKMAKKRIAESRGIYEDIDKNMKLNAHERLNLIKEKEKEYASIKERREAIFASVPIYDGTTFWGDSSKAHTFTDDNGDNVFDSLPSIKQVRAAWETLKDKPEDNPTVIEEYKIMAKREEEAGVEPNSRPHVYY
jgi:hypothetical protein